MQPRAHRLASLLVPSLLLAACGGGSIDSSSPAATPAPVQDSSIASGSGAARSGDIGHSTLSVPVTQPNEEGAALTVSSSGSIDSANPFFRPLGNGRSCASCHEEANGWTIGPARLQQRFEASAGLDPVFRLVDGANSPNARVDSVDARRSAYSMLLTRGVIRVGLALPADAEFTLERVDDPYGYASARELSLFRRPLPSANLRFSSTLMWDGRETLLDAASSLCIKGARPAACYAALEKDLAQQASDAVKGHAEATSALSESERAAIVAFEQSLTIAQQVSKDAGDLSSAGALGGPANLARTDFYFGINDVDAGDYRSGAAFNRNVFNLFGAWRNLGQPQPGPRGGRPQPPSAQDQARAAIARGEQLFNTRPFTLTNVAGFTDTLRPGLARATCSSCHSAPNAGSLSVPRLFNTGTSAAVLRTPDLPLYTLKNKTTGEVVEVSDPGAAMQSGRWRDIGKMKTPSLRGLEARSPYFHDGSATSVEAVVRFYDRRFRIGLTPQEVADLSAFLKAL
ncbi:cytochrome c peroxidase [Massilia sp. TS11]|uniref:cytochrome c peroxidase n=1 Tax=Massilia sp. TS11 TaxID=2908003 RepID=UPI001EDB3FF8|nr:cytochrome c peroxidase [Massilia sp. TS11]MCG2585708.1 cytochrome C [Massilia sp. TS11]